MRGRAGAAQPCYRRVSVRRPCIFPTSNGPSWPQPIPVCGTIPVMTARATLPYGSWPSPISAADVARARLRLSFPTVAGDDVWWQETRPEEGGRTTVIHLRGGRRTELLQAPWDARTRVHEYGGRSYLPVRTGDGWSIVFSNYDDQRLHRLDEGDPKPYPLTPEPPSRRGSASPTTCCPPTGRRSGASARATSPRRRRRARRRPRTPPHPARHRGRPARRHRRHGRRRDPRAGDRRAVLRLPAPSPAAGTWRGCSGTTRACPGTAPRCGWRRSRTAPRSRPGPSRAASPSRRWRRCGATRSPST